MITSPGVAEKVNTGGPDARPDLGRMIEDHLELESELVECFASLSS
jgi:hypothetical protein